MLKSSLGKYAEAEKAYRRAVAIRERVFGPEHPIVGLSCSNLGLVLYNQGRYAAAEPEFLRTLTIWQKTFGPEHPNVGGLRNNLGKVVGLDVELANVLAAGLGVRLELLRLAWDDIAAALNSAQIDIVMSGLLPSPDRRVRPGPVRSNRPGRNTPATPNRR